MDPADFRERLRVYRAFQLNAGETASQDFSARAARLASEGIEAIEIVLVHTERNLIVFQCL
jgi:hypothetical protein